MHPSSARASAFASATSASSSNPFLATAPAVPQPAAGDAKPPAVRAPQRHPLRSFERSAPVAEGLIGRKPSARHVRRIQPVGDDGLTLTRLLRGPHMDAEDRISVAVLHWLDQVTQGPHAQSLEAITTKGRAQVARWLAAAQEQAERAVQDPAQRPAKANALRTVTMRALCSAVARVLLREQRPDPRLAAAICGLLVQDPPAPLAGPSPAAAQPQRWVTEALHAVVGDHTATPAARDGAIRALAGIACGDGAQHPPLARLLRAIFPVGGAQALAAPSLNGTNRLILDAFVQPALALPAAAQVALARMGADPAAARSPEALLAARAGLVGLKVVPWDFSQDVPAAERRAALQQLAAIGSKAAPSVQEAVAAIERVVLTAPDREREALLRALYRPMSLDEQLAAVKALAKAVVEPPSKPAREAVAGLIACTGLWLRHVNAQFAAEPADARQFAAAHLARLAGKLATLRERLDGPYAYELTGVQPAAADVHALWLQVNAAVRQLRPAAPAGPASGVSGASAAAAGTVPGAAAPTLQEQTARAIAQWVGSGEVDAQARARAFAVEMAGTGDAASGRAAEARARIAAAAAEHLLALTARPGPVLRAVVRGLLGETVRDGAAAPAVLLAAPSAATQAVLRLLAGTRMVPGSPWSRAMLALARCICERPFDAASAEAYLRSVFPVDDEAQAPAAGGTADLAHAANPRNLSILACMAKAVERGTPAQRTAFVRAVIRPGMDGMARDTLMQALMSAWSTPVPGGRAQLQASTQRLLLKALLSHPGLGDTQRLYPFQSLVFQASLSPAACRRDLASLFGHWGALTQDEQESALNLLQMLDDNGYLLPRNALSLIRAAWVATGRSVDALPAGLLGDDASASEPDDASEAGQASPAPSAGAGNGKDELPAS